MNNLARTNNLVKVHPTDLAVQVVDHIDKQERVAANMLVAVDHVQKDMISAFAYYTDPTGESATSAGGLKTQINKRIKAAYGRDRESMIGAMRLHCSACMTLISKIIEEGIEANETRRKIKDDIWEMIKIFGLHYQDLRGFFHES